MAFRKGCSNVLEEANNYRAPITIIGDDDFIKRTKAALSFIEEGAPEFYAIVTNNIGIIQRGEYSGILSGRTPPTFCVGERTYKESNLWYASAIVHDANHSKLYHDYLKEHGSPVPFEKYAGRSGEDACLSVQADFLRAVNAPGWVAKAVNGIPLASPILRSFVKVQVGSPKKDAAEILETEKRRNAVIGVLAKELFETARKEGQDISLDTARYVGKLEEWEKRYGFTPDELAKIEASISTPGASTTRRSGGQTASARSTARRPSNWGWTPPASGWSSTRRATRTYACGKNNIR